MNFNAFSLFKAKKPDSTPNPNENTEGSNDTETADSQKNGISEKIKKMLSEVNLENFKKLSKKGQEMVIGLYKEAYKTPQVNEVIAKIELTLNTLWENTHQNIIEKTAGEIVELGENEKKLDTAKGGLEDALKKLKSENLPGSESLELKIEVMKKKIEEITEGIKKRNLAFTKEKESHELFVENRKRICDKLIDYYDKILSPLNTDKQSLTESLHNQNSEIARSKEGLTNREEKLTEIDGIRDGIIASLVAGGMKEEKAKKFKTVTELNAHLEVARNKLAVDRKKFDIWKEASATRINEQIRQVDELITPLKERLDAYKKLRDGLPKKAEPAPAETAE